VSRVSIEFKVHPYVEFMADRYDPYHRWLKSQGIPIINGSHVPDVKEVALRPWDLIGGRAAAMSFSDQLLADAYVSEIAPGAELKPVHHLYEELVFISEGRGVTRIWFDEAKVREFEWSSGALFAIPLNAWFQHFNASGTDRVRIFSLTSAPIAFELYRDPKFIFGTDYAFIDRFDPSDEGYFSKPGEYLTDYYGGVLHANLISDIRAIQLVPREKRGHGNRNMYIHMAGGSMLAHVSQFPVGTYKKAHRHGPGAHVYMLDSTGYTLMWREGEKPERYDWREGTVVSPPAGYWHQHYNTGTEPCRFVALHASTAVNHSGDGDLEQIDFENEDPVMRAMYNEECAKNGVSVQMQ
jgi:mannose-6-phosphate isomerase-like protein (cupin superfamily)